MGYHNFPLFEQEAWKKINENSKEGTFAGTFSSRDKVNLILQQICKRGSFNTGRLQQSVLFGNRGAKVQRLKEPRCNVVLAVHITWLKVLRQKFGTAMKSCERISS